MKKILAFAIAAMFAFSLSARPGPGFHHGGHHHHHHHGSTALGIGAGILGAGIVASTIYDATHTFCTRVS